MIEILSLIAALASVYYARKQIYTEGNEDNETLQFIKEIKEDHIKSSQYFLDVSDLSYKKLNYYYDVWLSLIKSSHHLNNESRTKNIIAAICIHEIKFSLFKFNSLSENSLMRRLLSIEERNNKFSFLNSIDPYINLLDKQTTIGRKKPQRLESPPLKVIIPATYIVESIMLEWISSNDLINLDINRTPASSVSMIDSGTIDADIIIGADASISPIINNHLFKPLAIYGALTNRILRSKLINKKDIREDLSGNYTSIYGEKSSSFHHAYTIGSMVGKSAIDISESINLEELLFYFQNATSENRISVWSPYWKLFVLSNIAEVIPSPIDKVGYINNITLANTNLDSKYGSGTTNLLKEIMDYAWFEIGKNNEIYKLIFELIERENFHKILLKNTGLIFL